MPTQIYPGVLGAEGRTDALHRAVGCNPRPNVPSRPFAMPIQVRDGYQWC